MRLFGLTKRPKLGQMENDMSKKNFIYRPMNKRSVQHVLRQIRNTKKWNMTIEKDEGGWYSVKAPNGKEIFVAMWSPTHYMTGWHPKLAEAFGVE